MDAFQITRALVDIDSTTGIETNAGSPLFGQVTGASDWFSPRKVQLGVRADW